MDGRMKRAHEARHPRVQIEVANINRSTKDHGISCRPMPFPNSDFLEVTMCGPKGTPYENGKFKLLIEITESWPYQPPNIKFTTPVYHPNIDNAGKICLDILQMPPNGAYGPCFTFEVMLLSIQSLLATPNPTDPLQADIAQLYISNREQFNKNAKAHTDIYSSKDIVESVPTTEDI